MSQPVKFSDLVGVTLAKVEGLHKYSEEVRFMLDDVVGDPADLIGSPVLRAEERSSDGDRPHPHSESHTWTFYEIATSKGSVTIRWLGESNGYYSENVDFAAI